MLDPGQDAPARDAVANEVKGQIEATGTLKHENTWGLRKMAYEIDQRTEADYRWFRFEAPTELLEQLDHNLKIADGVLRFRVFKVDADTPVIAPPATSAPGPGASRERPSAPEAPQAAPVEAAPEAAAAEAPSSCSTASPSPPRQSPRRRRLSQPPRVLSSAADETAEPAAEQEAAEAPAEGEPGDTPA